MKKLLIGSLLLLCLSGTWAAGCSSSKSPAAGGAGAIGGNGNGTGGSGGVDAGTLPDAGPQDTAIRTITPDDSAHLLYSGRIDFTDPTKPTYSAPGATVTAKFTGNSVSVMFQDSFKGQNYYNVVIDKQTFLITPSNGKTTYNVAPDPANNVPAMHKKSKDPSSNFFMACFLAQRSVASWAKCPDGAKGRSGHPCPVFASRPAAT